MNRQSSEPLTERLSHVIDATQAPSMHATAVATCRCYVPLLRAGPVHSVVVLCQLGR